MKKAVFWDLAPCICGVNGAKSQKTAFFIVTAVKASNLTTENMINIHKVI
jgi:hypothetical protein